MIIIDRELEKRYSEKRPINICIIGAGFMGKAIASQIIRSTRGIKVVAIGNRTLNGACAAWNFSGIDNYKIASGAILIQKHIENGNVVATDDPMSLCEVDSIDLIVEVTGSVEFGAQVALNAIFHGKDIVTMNAELDGTLGPIIQMKAKQSGLIYTLSDGDQPGVQMNLWRFVRSIGLSPLVCGNIKGLHDPYRTPETQLSYARKWGQNPSMVTSFADGTKISFEQCCVANATQMTIEMRGMRGGYFDGHVDDLCNCQRYNVDHLTKLGGVVDYVVGSHPSPGVFVLATHDNKKQRELLRLYKLGDGPLYSFYTPYHLCHFEIPNSIARVAIFRDPILEAIRPNVDVVTFAKRNLSAGCTLDGIGGFMNYGKCETYENSRKLSMLPIGLSEGCRLTRNVIKDEPVLYSDVELPKNSILGQLRKEQDLVWNKY
jgi:predicted homoserine dehydrogenase-like protein